MKSFGSENEAVKYAKNILGKRCTAVKDNSRSEMLQRYIQKEYGYSKEQAAIMLSRMEQYEDIFNEFFDYARVKKFGKVQVCGLTAEALHHDYNLSPLGAYNYLVYLREEPENALAI